MSVRLTGVDSGLNKAEVEIYFLSRASRNHVLNSFLSAVVLMLELQTSSPWFNCDIHERVHDSPPHKISSSDSGSLSLGFRSPISIGGVLFNLERTTLPRKRNKKTYTVEREFSPKVGESERDKKQLRMRRRFLPADGAIERAHEKHGEGKVPRITHGDEHYIGMIL